MTLDEQFLAALGDAGINVRELADNSNGEPAQVWAPETGRWHCEILDGSMTVDLLVRTTSIGDLTNSEERNFIATALGVYCPELA